MEVDVLNLEGEKVGAADLPAKIFEAPINIDLMHQAYQRQMANARLGTHSTKTRGEVAGGGRKPWKQKGTGRARQGSTRAPQWVGGGRVHAPKPRSYQQDMPKKMRRAALRSALSAKLADKEVVVVDGLVLPEAKTKFMAQALNKLVGNATALILIPAKTAEYEMVTRSAHNIESAKPLLATYLNIRDLLQYDKLVLPLSAVDVLVSYLG
jgi:large subunit ribosomal protein L4